MGGLLREIISKQTCAVHTKRQIVQPIGTAHKLIKILLYGKNSGGVLVCALPLAGRPTTHQDCPKMYYIIWLPAAIIYNTLHKLVTGPLNFTHVGGTDIDVRPSISTPVASALPTSMPIVLFALILVIYVHGH